VIAWQQTKCREDTVTCIGTRYQLAKVDSSVLVANSLVVDLLPAVTCLGVTIDQELTFADHIG